MTSEQKKDNTQNEQEQPDIPTLESNPEAKAPYSDSSTKESAVSVKFILANVWQWFRKSSPTDWLMVATTIIIACFTYDLAKYALNQAEATRRTAIADSTAAEANLRANVIAESTAVIARQAADISERATKFQARAWVDIESIKQTPLEANKEFRVEISVKNFGNTPANDVSILKRLDIVPKNILQAYMASEAVLVPYGKHRLPPRGTPSFVWEGLSINEEDYVSIKEDQKIIALRMWIIYYDVWNERSQENFWFTYAPNIKEPAFIRYSLKQNTK